jgi:hypothetical protein
MGVQVSRNFPPLATLELTNREIMREIGILARERIYQRTIAGRDMHDHAFQPYSADYAATKRKELGAGPVNLQVSGAMLNALVIIDLTDDSVTLGFSS